MTTSIKTLAAYAITPPAVQSSVKTLNAYVISAESPTAQVRTVSGLALIEPTAKLDVRKIYGLALIADIPREYLKMKGATALLTAINKEHSKSLTTAQVSFLDPSAIVGDITFNASVPMIPAADWLYSGQMVFRYNRYDLVELLGTGKPLPTGNQTTIHERLPAINAQFLCNLEPRDVVDGPVSSSATGLTLKIAATSYLFVPGSQVRLGTSDNLSVLAPVKDLVGFDPEG